MLRRHCRASGGTGSFAPSRHTTSWINVAHDVSTSLWRTADLKSRLCRAPRRHATLPKSKELGPLVGRQTSAPRASARTTTTTTTTTTAAGDITGCELERPTTTCLDLRIFSSSIMAMSASKVPVAGTPPGPLPSSTLLAVPHKSFGHSRPRISIRPSHRITVHQHR